MKWHHRLLRYPEIWLLTGAALLTRLWQLHLPPAIVFDEVYFRTFAANYLTDHYYFDIHPPLIKLLFGTVGKFAGLSSAQIADGDVGAIVLRLVPALAGALLVPLIYIIIRQFGLGRRVATLGALFVLFDNALLVESRFVLMDSILLLFGMGALSCYLAMRKSQGMVRWAWVLAMAVLLGLLVTTKWTGLAMVGLLAVAWIVEGVQKRIDWRQLLGEAVVVLSVMAAIYIGTFAVHFAHLTHSGDGDAFMSEKFRSTLVGNPKYDKNAHMAMWDKIVELNTKMYTAQNTLVDVQHPYSSKWYTWPFEIRPVYYFQGVEVKDSKIQAHIYLLGNPVMWWTSAVATLAALLVWLVKPRWLGSRRRLTAFLLLGYGINFIPFAFIDRPMFLYHYLFALLFSILITCVMFAQLFDWQRRKYGMKVVHQTFWGVAIAVLLGFLFFFPISYGWPVTPDDLQMRIWLPTWR